MTLRFVLQPEPQSQLLFEKMNPHLPTNPNQELDTSRLTMMNLSKSNVFISLVVLLTVK